MRTLLFLTARMAWITGLLWPLLISAQELKPLPLPKPQIEGGRPLMQALRQRRTDRAIATQPLPRQTLSNLLWAGFGVNRPETGGRTAPSAMNSQEMDIYVATSEGLYLYDAQAHGLKPVLAEDLRRRTGTQSFALDAPVTLIYVADFARMTKAQPGDKDFYSAIDTGFISQNVYLYCASEGLATVVHAVNRPALAQAMHLRSDQKVVLAQAVGFPKP